jgi:hypothetical protein
MAWWAGIRRLLYLISSEKCHNLPLSLKGVMAFFTLILNVIQDFSLG